MPPVPGVPPVEVAVPPVPPVPSLLPLVAQPWNTSICAKSAMVPQNGAIRFVIVVIDPLAVWCIWVRSFGELGVHTSGGWLTPTVGTLEVPTPSATGSAGQSPAAPRSAAEPFELHEATHDGVCCASTTIAIACPHPRFRPRSRCGHDAGRKWRRGHRRRSGGTAGSSAGCSSSRRPSTIWTGRSSRCSSRSSTASSSGPTPSSGWSTPPFRPPTPSACSPSARSSIGWGPRSATPSRSPPGASPRCRTRWSGA